MPSADGRSLVEIEASAVTSPMSEKRQTPSSSVCREPMPEGQMDREQTTSAERESAGIGGDDSEQADAIGRSESSEAALAIAVDEEEEEEARDHWGEAELIERSDDRESERRDDAEAEKKRKRSTSR